MFLPALDFWYHILLVPHILFGYFRIDFPNSIHKHELKLLIARNFIKSEYDCRRNHGISWHMSQVMTKYISKSSKIKKYRLFAYPPFLVPHIFLCWYHILYIISYIWYLIYYILYIILLYLIYYIIIYYYILYILYILYIYKTIYIYIFIYIYIYIFIYLLFFACFESFFC